MATTETLDTLIHCFRGCSLAEIHAAALTGEVSGKAEYRARTEADLADQKRRTDFIWERTGKTTADVAAHRYLKERLGFSRKGWADRHLEYLGRDVRAVRQVSVEHIHNDTEKGLRFVPPDWERRKDAPENPKPFAVAYGYRPPLSEDPPGLIQLLALNKLGRRHRDKRWRSAVSRGRLAEGAVCEALNLREAGPLVIAEAPVTAIAAAFIVGKTIAKPSYAIAAYGAAGLANLDVHGLREALESRDGTAIGDLVVAVDGDPAGRQAADALLAANPQAKALISDEGKDAADDWQQHLRTGQTGWAIREA